MPSSTTPTYPIDTGSGTSYFGGAEFIEAKQYPPFKTEQAIFNDIVDSQTMKELLDPTDGDDPSALYTVSSFGVLDSQEENGRVSMNAEYHAESDYAVCDHQLTIVYQRSYDNKFELVDVKPYGHNYYGVRAMPSEDLFERFLSEVADPDCTLMQRSEIQATEYGECSVVYSIHYPSDIGEDSVVLDYVCVFQDGAWIFYDEPINQYYVPPTTQPGSSVEDIPGTGSDTQQPGSSVGDNPGTGSGTQVPEQNSGPVSAPGVRTDSEILDDLNNSSRANRLMAPASEYDSDAVFTFTGISNVIRETEARHSDTVWLTVSGSSAYANGELDLKLTYYYDYMTASYVLNDVEATSYPKYTITSPPSESLLNEFYVKNLKSPGIELSSASFNALPDADDTYAATFVLSWQEGSCTTVTETCEYICDFSSGAWDIQSEPMSEPAITYEYNIPEVTAGDLTRLAKELLPGPVRDVAVTLGDVVKSEDDPFHVVVTGCGIVPNGDSKFDFSGFSMDVTLEFSLGKETWAVKSASLPDDIPAKSPQEYLVPFSVDIGLRKMYVTITGLRYHEKTRMYQFVVVMRREGQEGIEYLMESDPWADKNEDVPTFSFLRNIDIEPACYIYLNSDMVPTSYDTENSSLR